MKGNGVTVYVCQTIKIASFHLLPETNSSSPTQFAFLLEGVFLAKMTKKLRIPPTFLYIYCLINPVDVT
ncbi:hypothetical protein CN470_27310 [Bacillus cereus]|nr:hypothetical protein BCAH1134_C0544 [Bacillus cereus AH1134]PEQ57550.1 hypothetical protein CN470_27310 [Bacillus cereus]PET56522.1 hypothetical protein CN536_24430 [Bacillus cereus]PFA40678.1 hypothetical protein CN381_25400 [Bacillus cereus]PFS88409.1 hypothetical protein COK58_28700 [Bacillus cereus]